MEAMRYVMPSTAHVHQYLAVREDRLSVIPTRVFDHVSSDVLRAVIVAAPVILLCILTVPGWLLFPVLPTDRRRDLKDLAELLLKPLSNSARATNRARRSGSPD